MPPTPTTVALALVGGVLYFAAFPPLDVGVLGWVALVPLLVAVRGRTPRAAALLGWLTGTVAATALTGPSVWSVALRADRTPAVALAAAVVIPQLYGALWFGGFAWLVARLGALRDARGVVLVPAAWVACELGRSQVGHACPWALLAHSQATTPVWLQLADVAGAAGPGFVLATASGAVALLLVRARGARVAAVVALLVVAGAWRYGAVALAAHAPVAGATSIRLALVQGDVPDEWRGSLARLGDLLRVYRGLTAQALDGHPALVVWPENAVGISPDVNASAFASVLDGAGGRAPALLVGAPRAVPLDGGGVTLRNSAWLLEPGRGVVAVHDKSRLAPFGEASPWSLLGPVARLAGVRDEYSAGTDATLFVVDGHRLGTLICFEAIYADVARRLVADGAELLVNVSNDAWFGGHAGMAQHFRAALLRAVETRRWLVRGTNAGITAAIDPRGVVVARAPMDVPAVLAVDPVPAVGRTPYVRWGDWFAWTCVGVLVIAMTIEGNEPRRGQWLKKVMVAVVVAGLVGALIPAVQMLLAIVRGK